MSDQLRPHQSLKPGEALTSSNGAFEFVLQTDGNLVLYRRADERALWASDTMGKVPSELIMQGDGNLVLLGSDPPPPPPPHLVRFPEPIWAAGTDGKPGSFLVMQDDGNAVIYQPNVAVWATDTLQG
jgi:hypothetical protein